MTTDPERYATAQASMLRALAPLTAPGYKPTHAVAGLACALRAIGIPEREIRQSLAAVLLVGEDGGLLPPSAGHVEVDAAHALMVMPVGSVSRGGQG